MGQPFTLLRNALIMPFEGAMTGFRSGVFVNGRVVDRSLLYRWNRDKPFEQAAEPLPPETCLKGTYVYGGCLFGHYGHFLWESLSRLYAWRQLKRLPLLFVSPNTFIAQWQRDIFRLVGVSNAILVIRKPTLVENLVMAEAGSVLRWKFLPEQVRALGQYRARAVVPGRRIWVSRSHLPSGRVVNESVVEKRLAALGWEICHPQELPVLRQVETFATAEWLAGFDGSAFHTVLLAEAVRGHLTLFARRGRIDRAYTYIAELKGLDQRECVVPVEHLAGEAALADYRLADLDSVLHVLCPCG